MTTRSTCSTSSATVVRAVAATTGLTVYKVRDGYVLIWGIPRYDGDSDLYYEAVQ